jgi:hypothetical protein
MEFLCSAAGNVYLQKEFNSLSDGNSVDTAASATTDTNVPSEEPPLVSTEQF